MNDLPQILIALIGGGGITGILVKVSQTIRDHQTGKLDREDTVISKWERIANREEEEAREMLSELQWYRYHYAHLWAAYERLPPDTKQRFPPVPSPKDAPDGRLDGE